MENKEDLVIEQLLETEHIELIMDYKKQLRDTAKTHNILKQQELNLTQYLKKRKSPTNYNISELVAIQRKQFDHGLKLRPKFFGPYSVIDAQKQD